MLDNWEVMVAYEHARATIHCGPNDLIGFAIAETILKLPILLICFLCRRLQQNALFVRMFYTFALAASTIK